MLMKLITFFITIDEPHDNLYPAYGFLYSLGLQPYLNDNIFNKWGKFAAVVQQGSPGKSLFVPHVKDSSTVILTFDIFGMKTT